MKRKTAKTIVGVMLTCLIVYLAICSALGHRIRAARESETEADRSEAWTYERMETSEVAAEELIHLEEFRDPDEDLLRIRRQRKEAETETEATTEAIPLAVPPTYEAAQPPDYELTLLVYQVWGEISIADGTADYYGAKLQAAVVLNRIKSPDFPGSVYGVIYQPGQFETWWYEQLMKNGPAPNEACWQAVRDVITNNDTPPGLLYADSRSGVPNGCYLFYESPTGQRFYCKEG